MISGQTLRQTCRTRAKKPIIHDGARFQNGAAGREGRDFIP